MTRRARPYLVTAPQAVYHPRALSALKAHMEAEYAGEILQVRCSLPNAGLPATDATHCRLRLRTQCWDAVTRWCEEYGRRTAEEQAREAEAIVDTFLVPSGPQHVSSLASAKSGILSALRRYESGGGAVERTLFDRLRTKIIGGVEKDAFQRFRHSKSHMELARSMLRERAQLIAAETVERRRRAGSTSMSRRTSSTSVTQEVEASTRQSQLIGTMRFDVTRRTLTSREDMVLLVDLAGKTLVYFNERSASGRSKRIPLQSVATVRGGKSAAHLPRSFAPCSPALPRACWPDPAQQRRGTPGVDQLPRGQPAAEVVRVREPGGAGHALLPMHRPRA